MRTARTRPTAAFLDRDGTLIRDTGYVAEPGDVELIPGAGEAVRLLNEARIPVVIVTNQSGIGRGLFDEHVFQAVQERVEKLLRESSGGHVAAVYVCPHAPEEQCECRKPGLKLYRAAAARLGLEMAGALFAGDRLRDVLPALAVGGTGMLVAQEGGAYDGPVPSSVVLVPDLLTGVRELLGR